jgi:hypothetical protein
MLHRRAISVIVIAAVCHSIAVPLQAQHKPATVQVSGHWVIAVKNADGSPAQRVAFDNAFLEQGSQALLILLLGLGHFGWWSVALGAQPRMTDEPVFGGFNFAEVHPPGKTDPQFGGSQKFGTLQVTNSIDENGMWFPILIGSATAEHDGVLRFVTSWIHICDLPPAPCGNSKLAFSSTTVPDSTPPTYADGSAMADGLRVQAGQRVEVTVELKFTAAPHRTTPPPQ